MSVPLRRRIWCGFAAGLLCIGILGLGALLLLTRGAAFVPPAVGKVHGDGTLRKRGALWELTLRGDAEALGYGQGRAFTAGMQTIDATLDASFRAQVRSPIVRFLLPPLVRLRYRTLVRDVEPARLQELAAEALAYGPNDPLATLLPTFDRLLIYHALYDIALSFEGSPLLGCSIFGVSGAASRNGHLLIGRNFDLDQEGLERAKGVIRIAETGKIPFASVAWPGMTGAVTGLSGAGLYAAINGARAEEPRRRGTPLPFLLRKILQEATTLEEAIAIAQATPVMVSHILFLGDGNTGRMAVVERSPSRSGVRLAEPGAFAVTNHFLTPALAADARNRAIEASTSTLDRYRRLEELLPPSTAPLDLAGAIAVLRDRSAPGGAPLPPGDRRAIDAAIATHSVVADATARILYVAEGPHTQGRYLAFPVEEGDGLKKLQILDRP